MQTEVHTTETLAPSAAPATAQPLATVAPRAVAAPAAATPDSVLIYAMERGADLAQIEKLMDLKERHEANEARKAYVAAMAEFKQNPPKIGKDKRVAFETRDGDKTAYMHATLGNVTDTIIDGLAKHGFSHRWDTEQQDGAIIVTCVLTHRLGHSERTTLKAGADQSGKKNSIQAIGSTITYLQRYTLLAATGLATHDQDDDGAGAGAGEPENLAETWCGKAKAAPTLGELQKVWDAGVKRIEEAQDREAYEKFRNACNSRKAEIEKTKQQRPAGANRSSRLSDIVGNQNQPPAAE